MKNNLFQKLSVVWAVVVMLFMAPNGMAQKQNLIFNDTANPNTVEVVSDDHNAVVLKFSLNQMDLLEVETESYGPLLIPFSGQAPLIMEEGSPELMYLQGSVIIPNLGSTEVFVELGQYEEFQNMDIAPSKGNLTRDITPSAVPFKKGEIYNTNDFFPGELAKLRDPYVLRDYRGQSVEVYPLQYNPVTKTLRVYKEITVKIVPNNEPGVNELIDQRANKTVSEEFHSIYSRNFLNYASSAKYTPIEEDGLLLVVAHANYLDAVKPLVNWKNQKGQPTKLISYADAGGSANNLKTYITNQYNSEEGLTFVLLVGDGQHIPPLSKTGDSDAAYGHIVGTDSYAEAFIGRFSAETVQHVEDQVSKTITYERDLTSADSWTKVAMGIASNEGGSGGDNGESDIQHMDVIRNKLLDYTYSVVHKIYQGQSGATAAAVTQNINDGVSFINYTGHGSQTTWVTTGFGVSHMSSLTNVGKYPYIMDVACVNGDFNNKHCFAEGFARATTNEGPTGSIAIFASTVNQSWAPPMRAQDEFTDILVESYQNNIKRTYGGLAINACMKMNDVYGSNGTQMTNTWVIFGDPSFVVRTDTPEQMNVSHNPTMFLGTTSFNISCDVEGALAAISYVNDDNETVLVAKGIVQDGSVTIAFDEPIVTPMDLTLTLTAYNKVTYVGEISAVPADEPYVVLKSYSLSTTPDYGKNVGINVVLENISENPYTANSVVATLSSENSYVTITDATQTGGNIAPGSEISLENAFTIKISDNVPDQHPIVFTVTIQGQYGGETYSWAQNFNIKANAPVLVYGEITVNDSESGNGDNVLDPGESGILIIELSNNGHASISNLNTTLTTTSNMLTIVNGTFNVESLEVGATASLEYSVSASSESTPGTVATLKFKTTSGGYIAEDQIQFIIGFVPEYCASGATSNQWSDLIGFTFGPLENFTEPGGTYDDFTNDPELVHEFMVGFTYPVSVQLGSVGTSYTKGAKVFIDWNYDGVFIEPQETAFTVLPQNANWTAEGTITIPADAPLGQKFVRVVVRETSNINDIKPCGTFSWGGTEDYRIVLVAAAAPVADFNGTPRVTVEGDVVRFTDLSTSAPASWNWNITPGTAGTDWKFVEGTSATSQHPKVQFVTANSYSVALTVTNPAGSSTETKAGYITINELTDVPTAGFMVDKSEILPGEVVQFTDTSNNLPISWSWVISPGVQNQDWSFVDGTKPTSQHPRVKFNKVGSYTVKLTATNVVGASEPFILKDAVTVLATHVMHTGTLTTCSGLFYDTGGANGNYGNNENLTLTVYPQGSGRAVSVTFSQVDIEASNDQLLVYNGPSATGTPLATITGKDNPGTLVASNGEGALTFVFTSNGSVNRPGWAARFGCEDNGGNWTPTEGLEGVRAYPNPFGNSLTLYGLSEVRSLEVFNLLGQKVIEEAHYGEESVTLSTQGLQAGVYLVRLSNTNGYHTLIKVIKQ